MSKLTQRIELRFARETKNTYRFEEMSRVPVLHNGTIYLFKHLFGNSEPPKQISITVSVEE